MSRLASQLARQEAEEVAQAIRALLATPLLTTDHDAFAFDLVRRHREALTTWFDENCGWELRVEPRRGYARLRKTTAVPDAARPVRRHRSTRAPFDRRRYALLCVIAAELSRPGVMTTIGLLAGRVTSATAAEPAIATFDSASRDERAAFVDALRLLERWGALAAVQGSTDTYLDEADAKVLYQVDEGRLTRLLAAPRPPSALGEELVLEELTVEPRYGDAADPTAEVAEAQRNLWLRHSITRRVLDDPLVYLDELSAAQRAYLASPTGRRLVRQAVERAGMVLEERAEGLLAVDQDAVATDTRFPDERSHAKHAALLLLDILVGRHGGEPGAAMVPVPVSALVERVERLLGRFPAWARAYQSRGGAARLTGDALDLLCAFGLATRRGGDVIARPAAARYALATERGDPAGWPGPALWEEP